MIGWFYNRFMDRTSNPEFGKRLGVLLASGLIVGESLFGVILSAIIYFSKKGAPLALVPDSFLIPSEIIGGIAFVVLTVFLYRWIGSFVRSRAVTT